MSVLWNDPEGGRLLRPPHDAPPTHGLGMFGGGTISVPNAVPGNYSFEMIDLYNDRTDGAAIEVEPPKLGKPLSGTMPPSFSFGFHADGLHTGGRYRRSADPPPAHIVPFTGNLLLKPIAALTRESGTFVDDPEAIQIVVTAEYDGQPVLWLGPVTIRFRVAGTTKWLVHEFTEAGGAMCNRDETVRLGGTCMPHMSS